jgi:hypothetical protein
VYPDKAPPVRHLLAPVVEPLIARALGVSERLLRDVLPEIPHLHIGRRMLIPVGPLEEWLREQAEVEKSRSDRVAEAIIADIRGDRK